MMGKIYIRIIIYCGGSVASAPHLSEANCVHVWLNVLTNNRLVQNICHTPHNDTAVRRYEFVSDALNLIFHQMLGRKIDKQTVVHRYAYVHEV